MDYLRNLSRIIFRNGKPVQIINYVTSRCNLRCEHCFYKDSLDSPDTGEIPREKSKKFMTEVGPVLWYSLAGGEPFIRKDLETIILDAQKICRPKVFSFPTNGWFTERTFNTVLRTLQRITNGNLILFFSVDGPELLHNKIRGQKSYEHLINTIEELRPLKEIYGNLYINLVTTIVPSNADMASEFVRDTIHKIKPDAFSINLLS